MIENNLHSKLEKIRAVFQNFRDLGSRDDLKVVLANLEHTNLEYRSVAYEAVSKAIALKDLQENNGLRNWKLFMEGPGSDYISQVHVGLGWAIAKLNLPYHHMNDVEYIMRSRVLDGCGYYDGIFRARQTLKMKKVPDGFTEQLLSWYDHGVGRSIWYSGLGDVQKIGNFVAGFPAERQASLWRGIGHAAAFIGGCDEKRLHELHRASGIHAKQLAIGTAMAARGRQIAGSMIPDTELACKCWWKRSGKEVADLTEELLPLMISENIYDVWIHEIGERVIIHDLTNK